MFATHKFRDKGVHLLGLELDVGSLDIHFVRFEAIEQILRGKRARALLVLSQRINPTRLQRDRINPYVGTGSNRYAVIDLPCSENNIDVSDRYL